MRSKSNNPSTPITPLLLTAVTATLSVMLLLYIHVTSKNTIEKYVPWVDASMEIKLEASLAHLWFEELLSGDKNESIETVNNHLDMAKWYAIAILDGGENTQGRYLPLKEKNLRLQVNQLLYNLQNFHKATQERYKLRATTASQLDEGFDDLFWTVMTGANELEIALKRHISQENRSQNTLLVMLFIAICSMTVISGYSIWRFTDNRARYLRKLSSANDQISEQNKKLKQLAHTDQLTGLPNRKMLETLTNQALSRVERNSTCVALTFIDLDFFKPINDQYGHNIGDKILINFTAAINLQLREGDTLSRLAGDEFILVIEADSEPELRHGLDQIMGRIHSRLEQPLINSPAEIHVRCSAGTAIAPKDAIEFEALLHCADQAMYDSKKKGRGQHCYYETEANGQTELLLHPTEPALEAANK